MIIGLKKECNRRHALSSSRVASSLALSIKLISDGYRFGSANKVRARARRCSVELDALQAREQLFPKDSHFHPTQMLPEANMRSVAERDMLVRRTPDIVFEGMVEHG